MIKFILVCIPTIIIYFLNYYLSEKKKKNEFEKEKKLFILFLKKEKLYQKYRFYSYNKKYENEGLGALKSDFLDYTFLPNVVFKSSLTDEGMEFWFNTIKKYGKFYLNNCNK
jgi:hypothetical protein